MTIIRGLAWVMVALSLMLLGADAISTLEMGTPVVRTTAEIIDLIGPSIQPMTGGGAADVVNIFLNAPLWVILGVVGGILTLILRPVD